MRAAEVALRRLDGGDEAAIGEATSWVTSAEHTKNPKMKRGPCHPVIVYVAYVYHRTAKSDCERVSTSVASVVDHSATSRATRWSGLSTSGYAVCTAYSTAAEHRRCSARVSASRHASATACEQSVISAFAATTEPRLHAACPSAGGRLPQPGLPSASTP